MAATARLTAPLPPAAVHAMARIEYALAAPERELITKVGQALGWGQYWKPSAHLGETATYITMWSQHELNAVYERVGGTVTTRPVQRHVDNVTWNATEIILTADLPDIG
ncbi:hypothetical protein, partial [Streptomyces virginiae]|uniref:hypothetical protein n=2 Tax=Streptomyces TaxID=1883 RepID=UPI0035E186C8